MTGRLDNTRLFMSLTAGAGTRCMSLLSSSPNLLSKGKRLLSDSNSQEEEERCDRKDPGIQRFHKDNYRHHPRFPLISL